MRYLWKLTKALVYWCRQTRSCKNTRIQQGRCIKVNMSVNSDTHMALKKPPLWMKLRLLTKQLMGLDLKLLFEIIFGSTKIQTLDDRLRSANTTTVLCPSSLWMKNFFQSDFFQGKFFSELHQIKINQVVCWLPKSWSSAIIWRQDFFVACHGSVAAFIFFIATGSFFIQISGLCWKANFFKMNAIWILTRGL